MRHFFKLILDVSLNLEDLVGVLWVLDLLRDLGSFRVHAGLKQALCVVELVLGNVRVELGQLIVHVGGIGVVLDVEVAMGKEGKGGPIARTELQLVCEDSDDLK